MNQLEQQQFNTRRFRKDWLTRKVVTAFGWLVLATFLLLIWHIFSNAFPLFKSPQLVLQQSEQLPSNTQISGAVELSSGTHFVAKDKCDLVLLGRHNGQNGNATMYESKRFPFSCQHEVLVPKQGDLRFIGVITPSHLFELYKLSHESGQYKLTLESSIGLQRDNEKPAALNQARVEPLAWEYSMSGSFVMLSKLDADVLTTYWFDKKQPLAFRHYRHERVAHYLTIPRSRQLLIISEGILSLIDQDNQVLDRQLLPNDISHLVLSSSQRSFFMQDINGSMLKWIVQNEEGRLVFRPDQTGAISLQQPLHQIVFDTDSNAGLIYATDGNIAFLNRMTNEVFESQAMALEQANLQWFGGQVFAFQEQAVHTFSIDDIQGVTTLKSLFGKVWYEGYAEPQYVWQTSSASANYETKFSIMPLIVGSLKASLLALLVAVPLALGAAIYTSYFAEPSVRQYLKPAIEMLEAVPSVVIGFIAAVWMVPIAEEFLLSVILFIVALPVLLVASAIIQSKVAGMLNDRFDRRWEILIIVLAVIVLGLFCFSLSDLWRYLLFGNDAANVQNDSILNISKTTIVVAVALGVAISPSIYSLAEDALFEVPDSIKQASFALGATKLQTLKRVIIAVAMPSILSAVMLGFGRAFGETMIVLMVTGNTPISDWNILEGLRSMTANLAIELQESNVNSSHFNTLFLTASILFIFTFIVNTAAEVLRNRLRKVYTDA